MLVTILIAAQKYLSAPAIYYVCWQYMFNISSCEIIWTANLMQQGKFINPLNTELNPICQ